ncbi:MAG TPA: hypothetical protein VKH45_09875 [Candidatus Acidoferrum sp.]|nr:hypothetical protein [Candidatus Acidoferrum sp.]
MTTITGTLTKTTSTDITWWYTTERMSSTADSTTAFKTIIGVIATLIRTAISQSAKSLKH